MYCIREKLQEFMLLLQTYLALFSIYWCSIQNCIHVLHVAMPCKMCLKIIKTSWDHQEIIRSSRGHEIIKRSRDHQEIIRSSRDHQIIIRSSRDHQIIKRSSDHQDIIRPSDHQEIIRSSDHLEIISSSRDHQIIKRSSAGAYTTALLVMVDRVEALRTIQSTSNLIDFDNISKCCGSVVSAIFFYRPYIAYFAEILSKMLNSIHFHEYFQDN